MSSVIENNQENYNVSNNSEVKSELLGKENVEEKMDVETKTEEGWEMIGQDINAPSPKASVKDEISESDAAMSEETGSDETAVTEMDIASTTDKEAFAVESMDVPVEVVVGEDVQSSLSVSQDSNDDGDVMAIVEAPSETTPSPAVDAPVTQPPAAPAKPYAKGQRLMYHNVAAERDEAVTVVGVHFDDFPNVYYTIQFDVLDEAGCKREKQTDARRLREMTPEEQARELPPPVKEQPVSPAAAAPAPVPPAATRATASSARSIPVKIVKPTSAPAAAPVQTSANVKATHSPAQSEAESESESDSQSSEEEEATPTPTPSASAGARASTAPARQSRGVPAAPQRPKPTESTFAVLVSVGRGRPVAVPGCKASTTVGDLMVHLARNLGVSAHAIRLAHRNRELHPRWTLRDAGIGDGALLEVFRAGYAGWGF